MGLTAEGNAFAGLVRIWSGKKREEGFSASLCNPRKEGEKITISMLSPSAEGKGGGEASSLISLEMASDYEKGGRKGGGGSLDLSSDFRAARGRLEEGGKKGRPQPRFFCPRVRSPLASNRSKRRRRRSEGLVVWTGKTTHFLVSLSRKKEKRRRPRSRAGEEEIKWGT